MNSHIIFFGLFEITPANSKTEISIKERNCYITVYFFSKQCPKSEITTDVWCCISELRGSCARINIIFQRFSQRQFDSDNLKKMKNNISKKYFVYKNGYLGYFEFDLGGNL